MKTSLLAFATAANIAASNMPPYVRRHLSPYEIGTRPNMPNVKHSFTAEDIERMEKAQQKRDRKAAKRAGAAKK